MELPNCSVALTFIAPPRVECHLAGILRRCQKRATPCGEDALSIRVWTEKVKRMSSHATPAVVPSNWTGLRTRPDAVRETLRAFRSAQIDTGGDEDDRECAFPNVTLVGTLNAVTALSPDFRGGRTNLPLLTQVAGRPDAVKLL